MNDKKLSTEDSLKKTRKSSVIKKDFCVNIIDNGLNNCPHCDGEIKYVEVSKNSTRFLLCEGCTMIFMVAVLCSKEELIILFNNRYEL